MIGLGMNMWSGLRRVPGVSGYARPAGSLNFTTVNTSLRPGDITQFNGIGSGAWSAYFDAQYVGGANRVLLGIRRSNGFAIQINNGQLRVSNWAAFTTGATTGRAAGRYQIIVSYNGTQLSAWIKPEGGEVVQEISAATVSFGFGSNTEVRFGSSAGASAAVEPWGGAIYCGALWRSELSAADREALFGGADPRNHAQGDLFWYPSVATAEDLTGTHITYKRFSAPTTIMAAGSTNTGGNADNFVVLRDPDTGEPVQHGGTYWAAYDTLSGVERVTELATSTNLTTWTYSRTILTSTTGADDEIRMCDFIYLGNVAGAHDPFQIYTANKNLSDNIAKICLYTSADLVTWTADAANPVFTSTFASKGVEDFRVVKVGSEWGAVYEQNGLEDGSVAIGAARHSGTVPAGAWTNEHDQLFTSADFGYAGPAAFIANPTIVKHDGTYYCFYEGANSGSGGTAANLNEVTFLRTSTDFFSKASWEKQNVVAFSSNSFPNCAIVNGGQIQHYNVAGAICERFTYDPTQLFGA